MYGPPEREAQGRGLMKREKEGAADSSRTENSKKGGWVGVGGENEGGGVREVIEREQEERCWQSRRKWRDGVEGWTTAASGETNGPAWRDSAQSIIFKQKQPAQENI